MSRTRANHSLPINAQLLREQSWLLHRSKKPYYANGRPRSGTLDTPEDLAKLARYDDALATLNKGRFTGLGFAINRGFQFIDLDKCRDPETGRIEKWARPLLLMAREIGAFTEVSMSGTGLHIVGKGDGGFPTFKGAHVELYSHGRYMAIGREVITTGTDPLPDLGPVLDLMDIDRAPRPERPALRLVAAGRPPMTWPDERTKIPKLLDALNPGMDYPDWIKVGMAIHASSGGAEEGLQMWDEWSQGDPEKYGEGVCARMWSGFKAGAGVTFGTLVYMVYGDDEPVSSRVILEPSRRRKEFTDDELVEAEYAPVIWPVEDLIPPGLTLLAAPPKMGKSYFVLQMALCVGSGVPFLGHQTTQVPVSYFDLEEWEELLQKRRKRIGTALGIKGSKVRYAMETSGGDVTVMEDIQRHIDGGSKLVIIDLLARVRDELGEDAKKNAYARDYAALRTFADFIVQRNPDVAIVIVHHTNKGSHEEWQSKISGSQGLAGATHVNMLMNHVDLRGLDDEARKEALKYRRLHVVGKAVEPDEMMLVMMESGGGWEVTEKTTAEVKLQGKHAEILQILREAAGEWMTAKDVHAQVEGTLDSIKKMLMRMSKKGEIESSGSGGHGYRLP